MGTIEAAVTSVFATAIGWGVLVLGLVTPAWVALVFSTVGLLVGIPAIVLAIRADERSKASASLLEEMKANVSSQVQDAEASLKHGA